MHPQVPKLNFSKVMIGMDQDQLSVDRADVGSHKQPDKNFMKGDEYGVGEALDQVKARGGCTRFSDHSQPVTQ